MTKLDLMASFIPSEQQGFDSMTGHKENIHVSNLKIVVYSPFSQSTKELLGHEIHYLNSNHSDRWDAFKIFPDSWICFLDADCILDEKLVLDIRIKIQNLCPFTILCGRYHTDHAESTLSRAYNTLCNTWLEAGLLAGEPRLLGGFFVIYSSSKLISIAFEKIPKWGAEDYRMARQLGKNEFKFKLSEMLFTSHKSKSDLAWFFKRAWIHGENRPTDVRANKLYWAKTILQQNPFSAAYILIHFGTVFISKSLTRSKQRFDSLKIFFGLFAKDRPSNQRI